MPIKLIGRTTDFKGKPLWEILGNLKNFGVGRIVIRNRFQRYPEPSYMKILKVGALPAPDTPHVSTNDVLMLEFHSCRESIDVISRFESVSPRADGPESYGAGRENVSRSDESAADTAGFRDL